MKDIRLLEHRNYLLITVLTLLALILFSSCWKGSSRNSYSNKAAIIFVPDESMENSIKGVSDEELAEIDYQKTMAMYYLDSLGITTYITHDTLLSFMSVDGIIHKINTRHFLEWGIVLFDPYKQPKVIHFNDLEVEYPRYYNLQSPH